MVQTLTLNKLFYFDHCLLPCLLMSSRVFVLADPAVFSVQLEATIRAELEASSYLRKTPTMEKNVVLRVLQTGLGTTCQSSRLAQALEVGK